MQLPQKMGVRTSLTVLQLAHQHITMMQRVALSGKVAEVIEPTSPDVNTQNQQIVEYLAIPLCTHM